MKDLQSSAKQLQIFYTFISNYDILNKTVRELALSGNTEDYMRAEGLCDVVGHFIYGKKDLQDIKATIEAMTYPEKLEGMVNSMLEALSGQQDSLYMQLNAKHQMLLDILLLRDTIRPTETREQRKAQGDEEVTMIKEDPGHTIHGDDLKVLNDIASAAVTDGVLLSDYSKRFKTPETRDTIKRLYYESDYYFEQAFSNTDVRIQYILLEIIEEDSRRFARDQKKMAALQALRDLHVLSTIDTSANKMTSKVSDHQAFELFLSALSRNNNDFIIKKLLNDNIIMNTLFDISAMSDENHYGFRRMFITAKYPYDGIIVQRFRELKKINSEQFSAIIKDLTRDKTFKEAYENYQKAERTHAFMALMKDTRGHLFKDVLNEEMVYGLCYLLDEFAKLDDYNHDILTVDDVMFMVEEIYWYIIRKKAYGRYPVLEASLDRFFRYRIDDALHSTRLQYKAFGGETTYGITSQDLWYDIHRMVRCYGFDKVKTVYIRYGKDEVYRFEIGHRLKVFEGSYGTSDRKGEKDGSYSFICANNEGKGFEQYVFNMYGRFVKAFMNDSIETKLASVTKGTFRKVEIPGLSTGDDKRVRKAMLDYMTLKFLWEKDSDVFLHVYKMRVSGVLKAITGVEMGMGQVKQYLKVTDNKWVLKLLERKAAAEALEEGIKKLTASARDKHYIEHAEKFFELAIQDGQEE